MLLICNMFIYVVFPVLPHCLITYRLQYISNEIYIFLNSQFSSKTGFIIALLNYASGMYSMLVSILHPSIGGAQGPHPNSDPGVVRAPGGPAEPAKHSEGPGL